MQYTLPDLMYAVNHLSSYSGVLFAPAFQGIKHIIRYLYVFPMHPVIYLSVIYGTTIH